ncbi:MAG: trypsin-like peptidase domain-containing protein, partial [Nitrosarchaeum sp.]|nr:trypsin-like peptidase domain-containing protein [Nitrosarchaeum sp.]
MCIILFNSSNNGTKILLGGVIGSIVLISIASLVLLPTVLAQDNTYSSEIQSQLIEKQKNTKDLSLIEIFERSELGVVSITVTKSSERGDTNAVGSGFVFDKAGHIITNNHVVADTKKITVTFIDGTSYRAKIIGTDPYADIAVIKLDISP